MTIERPDQDVAELFGPPPARTTSPRCTRISSPGPRRKACSTSATAPSTRRSAPCCWPPPRPGWSGSRTEREGLDAVLGQPGRQGQPPDPRRPRGGSTRPSASSRSTSAGAEPSFDLPLDLRLSAGFRRSVLTYLPASATGRPPATSPWRPQSTTRKPCGPSAPRAPPTLCPLSSLAIGSSAPTASSGAYLGGPEIKHQLLDMEAHR